MIHKFLSLLQIWLLVPVFFLLLLFIESIKSIKRYEVCKWERQTLFE